MPAGMVTEIEVVVVVPVTVAATPPIETDVWPDTKFVPVIVRAVPPPASGPLVDERVVIVGAARYTKPEDNAVPGFTLASFFASMLTVAAEAHAGETTVMLVLLVTDTDVPTADAVLLPDVPVKNVTVGAAQPEVPFFTAEKPVPVSVTVVPPVSGPDAVE